MAPGFLDLIRSDLDSVDRKVEKTFKLRPGHLSKFAHIETNSVQTYLHPALVLLVGRIFRYSGEKIIYLASVIQLIYLASNVHFRIPDDNEQDDEGLDPRDGARFPVLVGDYLYGKYFVGLSEGGILELLTPLSNIIAEMNYGALIRKKNAGHIDIDFALTVVEKETALLMEGAARYSATISGASPWEIEKIAVLGRNLGMAYGILERNLGPAMAEPYFDAAEQSLKDLPENEARESLFDMIREIRTGKITVPPKKTGRSFDPADLNGGETGFAESYRDKEEYVQSIFSAIAKHYDAINTVLSLNQDKYWRKFTVQLAKIKPGGRALDVCCGTGMMTVEIAKKVGTNGKVVGLDINSEMLEIAKKNLQSSPYQEIIEYVHGNAMELPFPDNSFDCATIGFGLRNIPDIKKTLREMQRVVKPGSPIVCLEFSKPYVPVFKQVYNFYFDKFVPFFGKFGAGKEGPYRYLQRVWRTFPNQKELRDLFSRQGLQNATYYELTGGVVSVHVGFKPVDSAIPSVAATTE